MKLFNEGERQGSKKQGKKSIFSSPAMDAEIERRIQTQAQIHVHQRADQAKSKTHNAVHFQSVKKQEEVLNTAC